MKMAVRCQVSILVIISLSLQRVFVQGATINTRERDVFDADHIDDTLEELAYLRKNGYVTRLEGAEIINNHDGVRLESALDKMQDFFRLNITGELDDATREVMSRPRCGFSDLEEGSVHPQNESLRNRVRRYTLIGKLFKWDTNKLTYGILNYPSKGSITPRRFHYLVRKAFNVWSMYIPINFKELKGRAAGDATIRISFLRGKHSHDREHPSFDGAQGDLAHAFSPKSGWGEINGDIHFDDDETFTVKGDRAYHLYQITTHEIGHALGLLHSKDPNSIMWPMYRYWTDNRLPADDVRGIQALYGRRTDQTTFPPRKRLFEGTYCGHIFSLVFSMKGTIYAFRGYYYWEAKDYKLLTPAAGKKISKNWYSLPLNVNAAYGRPDGTILFFKGIRYWRYRGSYLEAGYPRYVTDFGLTEPVDAVLAQGSRTFFFHGKQVSKYIEGKKRLAPGYPKPIQSVFGGIPSSIDNAFLHSDGHAYLISGKKYYRMSRNHNNKWPDYGYPRDFTVDFLGCNAPV